MCLPLRLWRPCGSRRLETHKLRFIALVGEPATTLRRCFHTRIRGMISADWTTSHVRRNLTVRWSNRWPTRTGDHIDNHPGV
jgi:hypothetical protein